MQVVLTAQEAEILALVLRKFVVRDRTGEVGIVHGADRFIGTSLCLRKPDRTKLDSAARKLGLSSGLVVQHAFCKSPACA